MQSDNNNSLSDKLKILDDKAPKVSPTMGETSSMLLGKDDNLSGRLNGIDTRPQAAAIAVGTGGANGLDAPNFDSGAPSTSYNQ